MIKFLVNFLKVFLLIFIASCGKKSGLLYPEEKKFKFDKIIESNDINDSDKNFKYYFDREQPKSLKDLSAKKKTANKNKSQNNAEDSDNQ